MKIAFLGAAHEVTGSCTLITVADKNILVDCGLEQGPDTYENSPLIVMPTEIDCVILTHAHIDHSGKIPELVKNGFDGPIYSTTATKNLCEIMLLDSAHIQESEAQWRNKRAKRAGQKEYVPLYTTEDAARALTMFRAWDYGDVREIFDGITLSFTDAGHLLGSSSTVLKLTERDEQRTVVFSGDIGNSGVPIVSDPVCPGEADVVIMESTYGDRSHGERIDYIEQLVPILESTFSRGGNVVIPSFAVGRTQELLYFFREIKKRELIKSRPHFPVYVDSPLAVEATQVFSRNMDMYFDSEAKAILAEGVNPINFEDLRISISSDDSKAINFDSEPKVIISASGMCEAGRIRHHLKHNLWRPECTVLFVGYQAVGTLGRSIVEGAKDVKLFDERIAVNARIATLKGISGHADDGGLMDWIKGFETKPETVYVNHGDDEVCELFANRIKSELHIDAKAPFNGAEYDLVTGECLDFGNTVKREKKPTKKTDAVFEKLAAASKRLAELIKRTEGKANRDVAKFTEQINNLCDKWEN